MFSINYRYLLIWNFKKFNRVSIFYGKIVLFGKGYFIIKIYKFRSCLFFVLDCWNNNIFKILRVKIECVDICREIMLKYWYDFFIILYMYSNFYYIYWYFINIIDMIKLLVS